ncbi:radical SAM protein [Geomesophilobacter sediminis]|uniref:Radical SAM protein n=1 Tax=Geomesophilobacter sediminis TaxID=2798584 RepID=A0A8J7S8F3_9BACT|nr:radical SAM protein [Geomesophilobacter sediminis]MBJ6727631.1 radical SAM protein [Geomesophilobacter sediminis]
MFNCSEPLYRPPSEAQSLIFQITIGCSQNNCAFCGMYKSKRFRMRPVPEILAEIESIPAQYRSRIRRVFLADGDALVYPQEGLVTILDALNRAYPALTRIGAYASPNSLTTKSVAELEMLQAKKLRILYFGLESGDAETLRRVAKGFGPEEMLELCRKAQQAGMKLSVTAILGLAGKERSAEHAAATARWVSELSPEYFSLLTMFLRKNDDYLRSIRPLSHGEVIEEALAMLKELTPQHTILRSNHVSNFLNLAGSYPKDRERLIETAQAALEQAKRHPEWFKEMPSYSEDDHF